MTQHRIERIDVDFLAERAREVRWRLCRALAERDAALARAERAEARVRAVETLTVDILEGHPPPLAQHFAYDGPGSTLSAVLCGCSARLPCDRRSFVLTVWREHVGRALAAGLSELSPQEGRE